MMEFQKKPVSTVTYEPVAYDKRIEAEGRLWRPVIRQDAEELRLPATVFLCEAQRMLDTFASDVFEGLPPSNSVFYNADRRFAPNAKFI